MTTANKLTILRVVLIPVFFLLMLIPFPGHMWLSLLVFVAASVTDYLDGHIARKYHQVTTFGKFMDPLADKLLVMAALVIFVQWGQIPAWAAFVILAREFAVTALRLIAAADGTVIAAGISGKVKTFSSLVCLCLMMTPLHGLVLLKPAFTLDALCVIVMVAVTVWSGAEYFIKYGKLLKVK